MTIRETCRKAAALERNWGPLAPFFEGNLGFPLWQIAKQDDKFGELAQGLQLLSKRGRRKVFDVAWGVKPTPPEKPTPEPEPEPLHRQDAPTGSGRIVRHRHGWEPIEGVYLGGGEFRGKDGTLYEIDPRDLR